MSLDTSKKLIKVTYEGVEFPVHKADPVLVVKDITENGTYEASADNAAGYSVVSVNVASSGGGADYLINSIINADGMTQTLSIYTPDHTPAYWKRKFSENTPDIIVRVANEIAYNNYTSAQVEDIYGWKVGDTTLYTHTDGERVEIRIDGYNHDDLSDNSGKAGITFEMTHCLATKQKITTRSDNSGGYAKMQMCTTTLPAVKELIPQDWRSIIKPVKKKSANGGDFYYSGINTLDEEIFLLSYAEFTPDVASAAGGAEEGSIYEYWIGKNTNDARTKMLGYGSTTTTGWWTRSCASTSYSRVAYVGGGSGIVAGSLGIRDLVYTEGISYAFCVGSAADYINGGNA